MRLRARNALPLIALLLVSCFYVSKEEYREVWDRDGDGWPLGVENDCAPSDPLIYPFAPDIRGDHCDSDCGREIDSDNDDWPDDADCAPNDPEIYPCAPDAPGGEDMDCDNLPDARPEGDCPGIDRTHPEAEPIPLDACPEDLMTAGHP